MITVNGKAFNCVIDYDAGRPKLWSEDTGRTYDSGKFKGTLIGVFPKLEVTFYPASEADLSSLITELDKGSQTVRYFDPKTNGYKTSEFYTNDYSVAMTRFGSRQKLWKPLKVTFIKKERD